MFNLWLLTVVMVSLIFGYLWLVILVMVGYLWLVDVKYGWFKI